MKIAISGDCFEVFTSGFPVRGMFRELIKMRPDDIFVVYYSRTNNNPLLRPFYDEVNNAPNVEVRRYKNHHKIVVLKRMMGLSYVSFDSDTDFFINPGSVEYVNTFRGKQVALLTDLSTIHGQATHKNAIFYKYLNRYYYNKYIPQLYQLNTISQFTRNDLLQTFPSIDPSKVKVIYNGIDDFWLDNHYEEVPMQPFMGEPYFIWWGVVSRRKNIENLIAAYHMQRQANPQLPKLLLVGSWLQYMEPLRQSIVHDDDIITIPFQENYVLKSLVKNSAGLIFPSYYEGFGLPVLEAFSQGVPVACSHVTSLPEVSNGRAVLFDPHKIEEIAAAIEALVADYSYDPEDFKAYAATFTYRNMAQAYSNLLDNLSS